MVPAAPFLPLLVHLASARLRRRLVEILPFALIQKLRYIVDIMASHMEQIFREKKQALSQAQHDETEQHDIMAVLCQ